MISWLFRPRWLRRSIRSLIASDGVHRRRRIRTTEVQQGAKGTERALVMGGFSVQQRRGVGESTAVSLAHTLRAAALMWRISLAVSVLPLRAYPCRAGKTVAGLAGARRVWQDVEQSCPEPRSDNHPDIGSAKRFKLRDEDLRVSPRLFK